MKKTSAPTTIKVYCRLRPLNRLEKEQGGECCVQFSDQAIKVKVAGNETPYDFAFDGIFGPESAQKDVFQKVAEPVINGLVEGYNGTIFAYGQTSSGKTFTMEGPDIIDSDEKLGIIPRMMNYVFNLMMNSSEDIEFNVKVSFLELYNEKVQDLLDSRKNNLQIKEDKTKGIIVQDATEVYVTSAEEMKRVHKSGSENRTMAATRMNERSSRSHSIFVLSVDQKDTKTDTTKHSKLYFVDLAGSEKISKTNVTGQQLEEAKNINKSLTALGIVINALTDKDKGHVPYRDSKLTRLLQESIGGNSQTSLILACSMCSYNDKETVDTLRFGSRAKTIKNAPTINAERSAKELTNLLTAAEKKILEQDNFIASLKAQISGAPLNNGMNKEAVQSNNENKKAEESETSADMSKKPAASSSSSSANSLFMLKNQIELANLKEELQEVKGTNKELENEMSAKNKEIYELNGKILQYEAQLAEFANKNVNALEEYQVQFEKLYHENQERVMLASKFKRAIHRLKADLNFTYISKHLMAMDNNDNLVKSTQPDSAGLPAEGNKDEMIVNSIKKTVEILEEIEKEIDESHKVTPNEDISNILDGLMKTGPDSATARTDTTSVFKTDTFNDEIKESAWMTEGSDESNKDSVDIPDLSKIEQENEDELQKSQIQELTGSDDEKINKLQALIANQRKTINSLSKSNHDLTHQNSKHLAAHEDLLQKYKAKAEEWQRLMKEKTSESNSKIYNLKSLLEGKMREIEDNRNSFEKELFDKDGRLSELREKNEKLQSLISGNEEAIRNYELENTLKVYVAERKRLAEDLMVLRKEVDEKDDIITEKSGQIEILQNNISLAAKEIKMLKQLKPPVAEVPATTGTCSCGGKTSREGEKKNRALKAKNDFVLFDKHVVKPIRGGGGDATKFAKNNAVTFDKPTRFEAQPEEKKSSSTKVSEPPKSSRGSFLNFNLGFASNEESKSTKAKDSANFKKFDEIMKQKSPSDSAKKAKPEESQRVHTDMDEVEEEEGSETMKDKWKLLANKSLATGQKKVGKLFTGVKNLFS